MDPHVVAQLQQIRHLAESGVISRQVCDQQQQNLMNSLLPALAAGSVSPGVGMFTGSTMVLGGGGGGGGAQELLQQPQRLLAPPPTPAPTGPTAQQLAAQQQLESVQQQQAAQMEQMQRQMQEQMAAAQAQLSAAAPAPVAAPQVQLREQARRTSSGEKPAAPASAPAAPVAAPQKASEKQSTDLDSKAKGSSSGTEKRAIVVMFCDICDSTAMSESLDAEDVREVVLVYQKFVGEVLVSLGGHIAQYLGDGILTYFGFPESDADAAQHAVEAGLEIIAALPKLNRELTAKGLRLSKPLRIRLGMHSGSVVIGAMGGGNRTETLALGDVPNIAARMESLSPTNGMAITPAIKDAVEHKFVCKPLVIDGQSSHFVKGIREAIAVFTIDSHKNAGAGAETVDLVGRTSELGQLQDMWQMLQMGQGQAVVVTGGAGIGKTALTSAFAQGLRTDESKPVVMLLKASEHRKSSPLYTAAQVLKRWASAELGERAQVRRALKDAGLEDQADTLSAPLLAVLGIEGSETSIPFDESKAALIEVLKALPRYKPLIIVVEDTEQIDAMSLELFDELAKELGSLKLFLVMCWRNANGLPAGSCLVDWADEDKDEVNGQHIHVNKMSKGEAEELAEAIAEGKTLPKEVVSHVVKHGDGIPLHLEQLTRSVLAADVLKLSADDGSYELTGNLSDLALPTTLENAIRANMDALFKTDPSVKLLVELTAVLGGNFTMAIMKKLWVLADGGDEDDLNKALMIAMKKKVVTSMSSKGYAPTGRNRKSSIGENMVFAFVHLRILDVCRSAVLKSRSRELHGLCAEVLSTDALQAEPEVLAWHLDESEDFEHAAVYWRHAINAARKAAATSLPFMDRCLLTMDRLEEQGPLSERSILLKMNTINDKQMFLQTNSPNPEAAAEWQGKLDIMAKALIGKVDNLRDITDPETKMILLKAMWATTFPDQFGRLQDDTISGLIEVPGQSSKMMQVSVDHAPDDHLLEGLFFSVVICAMGHEVALGPDTTRYKKMPSYEIHKKLRPGKPESEQWFHPGRKEFVPYDLSRIDGLIDLATLQHVAKSWEFEKHLPGDLAQFGGPFISVFPTQALAFMGDIDSPHIIWDKCVKAVQDHKATDYTSHGWLRLNFMHVQGGCNYFPLCRHDDTVEVFRAEGNVYSATDQEAVPKTFQPDDGAMQMSVIGDDGRFAFPMCGAFIGMTRLVALAHGVHDLSPQQLANLQLPAPDKLLPSYEDADGHELPLPGQGMDSLCGEFISHHGNMCFMAAEIYLQLGRFDEALAHNARNVEHSNGVVMIRITPWQRARILSAQRLAEGKGAPWSEIIALFEKTASECIAWGAPLIVVFSLKDMLALVPASELGDVASVRSRLEEYMFELTMETDTPLRRHLESGEAFMPQHL